MSANWAASAFTLQPGRASLRVSDAERDDAARQLGEHFAVGRLDQEEYNERSSRALTARTRGELDALFRDLPTVGAFDRPARPVSQARPAWRSRRRPPLFPILLVLLAVSLVFGAPWVFLLGLGLFLLARRARRSAHTDAGWGMGRCHGVR